MCDRTMTDAHAQLDIDIAQLVLTVVNVIPETCSLQHNKLWTGCRVIHFLPPHRRCPFPALLLTRFTRRRHQARIPPLAPCMVLACDTQGQFSVGIRIKVLTQSFNSNRCLLLLKKTTYYILVYAATYME